MTDVTQACNQTEARQWAERTRGPISGAHLFCANLTKRQRAKRTQRIRRSTSCGLQLKDQNWNLRSGSDSYMCVNALRSLSGSKPFLMIEWGTAAAAAAVEHTWQRDDHIWVSGLRLLPFNNYHACLLEWI